MKLDKTQLSKIIHNVFSYDYDENDNLHFSRFTESQKESYGKESPSWLISVNAGSSVTFDFISDSDYIVLKFDLCGGSSRTMPGFDLYVDGVFCQHKTFENLGTKTVSFSLPEGEHRITVYFPWSVETVVKEVHLSEGAIIKEIEKTRKVIFFGDSITQGYVAECPSLSYVNQVANETDSEVLNQGISAYYFSPNSIDETLISYNPDVIVIAYGTNDYTGYDDKKEFEKAATAYVEKLVSLFPHTRIIGLLPVYRNDENKQAREKYRDYTFEDSRGILRSIYEKHENVYVLNETGIPRIPSAFVSDYLHPNDFGFTFMAKSIAKAILKNG